MPGHLVVNAAKLRYPWVFVSLCMASKQHRPFVGLNLRPCYPPAIRTGPHERTSFDCRRRDLLAQR